VPGQNPALQIFIGVTAVRVHLCQAVRMAASIVVTDTNMDLRNPGFWNDRHLFLRRYHLRECRGLRQEAQEEREEAALSKRRRPTTRPRRGNTCTQNALVWLAPPERKNPPERRVS
jgi:hypothetical protein